ncbi:class I SAM-dependent rRNA methyltransferase [uncultured Oscillibacter sp.]|jgi:23S rRNA (cytosine1962-C5)-methyltransferase|uniref:class I SAM-dependent rRNA methyltransferase n=1 Tax=uncultured Oscillibacter sp. TaxID=876091 RepID=UPI00216C19D7|nr:class I SAM-dependent rRNA methyltransferase [uncultured Oscillibacter sp.]MCI9554736.1 class I SAM-dependent rRNA methyltransferase [Oscillibacter sp.]
MKTERLYPSVTVTPKAEAAILRGHPWVYDAEILSMDGTPENGGLTDVRSRKGAYLGTGFLSEKSKIRVRLLSRNANDRFDAAFWERKLRWAWEYRKTVMAPEDLDACRVVFGEADMFPGLTVDKFHDLLSVQVLSVGMERIKELLLPLLVRVLREDGQTVRGVFERNDAALREKEGLEQYKGWFPLPGEALPESPVTEIVENGVKYLVDVENGQKTGFFLDQKYNRRAAARLAEGKTVLDCFTHTGSFALNAALGGAKHVTAVDVSASAVEMARANAERNGLSGVVDCVSANVFELLPALEKEPVKYDYIILDPPAFTKSRKTAANAMTGYKEINYRAMKLLPRGGYLATCSCSHFAEEEKFTAMLHAAARDAGVRLRQIEARQQSCDHPILWGVEETNYLKFYLFQVV